MPATPLPTRSAQALVELEALPVQASDDSSTDRDLRRKQREEGYAAGLFLDFKDRA